MQRFFILLVALLFQRSIIGQHLTKQQYQTIYHTIESQFGAVADQFEYNLVRNNWCVIQNDTFFNPDGYNYVFKLKQGEAIRLDGSSFHGGNFQRTLFDWDKYLFSLGGYGFFTSNNNVSFFNPRLKGWVYKHTTGEQPAHILGVALKYQNKIFSFNNYKSGNSATKDLLDSNLYVLNLKKMHWEKFKLLSREIQCIGRTYHLKEYVLVVGPTHAVLFKNNSLNYIRMANEDIGLSDQSRIDSMSGNIFYLTNQEHKSASPSYYQIDFEKWWNKNTSKSTLKWQPINPTTASISWLSMIPWCLLIVSLLLFIFLLKKKNKGLEDQKPAYTDLHLRFVNLENKILSIEALDELLEISHLEADSKKLKRTRMINELNLRHPNFIERRKDESDKRRFVYIVNVD